MHGPPLSIVVGVASLVFLCLFVFSGTLIDCPELHLGTAGLPIPIRSRCLQTPAPDPVPLRQVPGDAALPRIIAVDAGANCGNSFELMQERMPLLRNAQVEWYLWEANPRIRRVWLRDLAARDDRVTVVPYAVWTHNSTLDFALTPGQEELSDEDWKRQFPCDPHSTRNPSGASTLVPKNRQMGPVIQVPTMSLAEWFKSLELRPDDSVYLKVDIEGAEYAVLRDLWDSGVLCKLQWVGIEWHSRFGCGNQCSLEQRLPRMVAKGCNGFTKPKITEWH